MCARVANQPPCRRSRSREHRRAARARHGRSRPTRRKAKRRTGGAGKASFQDFKFPDHLDKASPILMRACATGEHIKDATITVRKAGKGQQEYLVITMTDILVTSVTAEGYAAGEGVALAFAKVDLEYKPQKPDVSLDVGIHFKYDLKANKEG